jgi:hypothetical protein
MRDLMYHGHFRSPLRLPPPRLPLLRLPPLRLPVHQPQHQHGRLQVRGTL